MKSATVSRLLMIGPLCALALAQRPAKNLTISWSPSTGGAIVVQVSNEYPSPAVTWVASVETADSVNMAMCPPANTLPSGECTHRHADLFDVSYIGLNQAMQPTAVKMFPVRQGGRVVSASVLGVIYADGSVAGDPPFIRRLIAYRKALVTDALEDQAILVAALQDTSASRSTLLKSFRQREKDQVSGWNAVAPDGISTSETLTDLEALGWFTDPICSDVERFLAPSKDGTQTDLQHKIQLAIGHLERQLATLQAANAVLR